jgi:hypothetical protein
MVLMETTTDPTLDEYGDPLGCVDDYTGSARSCSGAVEYRAVPGGSPVARCVAHFDARLDRFENSIEREALSPLAPSWFDPDYAGERWDDDY